MLSAVRKAVGAKSRPEGAGEEAVPDAEGDCFADCHEAHLHPDAHSEGGLAFANLELLEAQRRLRRLHFWVYSWCLPSFVQPKPVTTVPALPLSCAPHLCWLPPLSNHAAL